MNDELCDVVAKLLYKETVRSETIGIAEVRKGSRGKFMKIKYLKYELFVI